MTKMEIQPFKDGDLEGFVPQKGQRPELTANWPELLRRAGRLGPAGSFKYKGQTVAVAGLLADRWGGQAWALLDERAGSCLLPLTRALGWFLRYFEERGRPITVNLRHNWPKAAKWARLLGFRPISLNLGGPFALWVYDRKEAPVNIRNSKTGAA